MAIAQSGAPRRRRLRLSLSLALAGLWPAAIRASSRPAARRRRPSRSPSRCSARSSIRTNMSAASSRSNSVEIRSRVSGYLSEIHFTDGQIGEEGRSPVHHRPAAVPDRARPDARQSRAGARQSRLHRGRPRARPSSCCTTRPSPSRPTTSARRPRAWPRPRSPRRRRWCIRPSSISNSITELRAPIDGRIGDRRVAVGNLVTGGTGSSTTLLATIVSVDPIRFEFTFDEASYLRYERFAGSEQGSRGARRRRAGRRSS